MHKIVHIVFEWATHVFQQQMHNSKKKHCVSAMRVAALKLLLSFITIDNLNDDNNILDLKNMNEFITLLCKAVYDENNHVECDDNVKKFALHILSSLGVNI